MLGFLLVWIGGTLAQASVTCEEIGAETKASQIIKTGRVLSKKNWRRIDVIGTFNYRACRRHVTQELIEVKGERFWRFLTNDDACDGGNVYGSIYRADMSAPVAHIYDGEIVCEKDWRSEYRAKPSFPEKLTCHYTEEPSEAQVLYTRLSRLPVANELPKNPLTLPDGERPKKDEVAWNWRGDFFSITIDRNDYHYSLWTCDTEDRFYVFRTQELLSALETGRVKGRVTISIREESQSFDLDCTAE